MKIKLKKNIVGSLIVVDIALLLLISFVILLIENYSFKNKADILLDTLRNDFISQDTRTLNQKLQIALSQHEFLYVGFDGGPVLERARGNLEFGVLDRHLIFPVFADVNDKESRISSFYVHYSTAKSLTISLLIWLLIVGTLFVLLPFYRRRIELQVAQYHEVKRQEFEYNLARKLAHDIRSPLSALRISVSKFERFEDEKEIVLLACERINDIANDLLIAGNSIKKNEETIKDFESFDLSNAINEIINEKMTSDSFRIELDSGSIDKPVYLGFTRRDFQRVISNLINNSIEAAEPGVEPKIQIFLRKNNGILSISISDNGVGIPHEIIKMLGEDGFSYGKRKGSGLGLYQAKSLLEPLGGKIDIQSKVGIGTVVSIHIPV